MKSQNTKSSDELKRDVHHNLRKVQRDLDEMTDMMSPGTLLDRAVFRRHNRSPVAALNHLKNNPIGTAFLSMGTLLLMEDEFNETNETKLRNRYVDMKGSVRLQGEAASGKIDEIKGKITDMKGDIKHRTMDMKGRVQNKVAGIKDTIQSKKGQVQEKLSDMKDQATDQKEGVHAKVTDFSDKVGDVTQNVKAKVQDIKEGVQERVHSTSSSDYENWTSSATEPRSQKIKDALNSAKKRISSGMHAGRDKITSGFETGRETVSNMDPVTYMAMGAGLGILTGVSLPVSEKESNFVNEHLSDGLTNFDQDIRDAINECSNLLKDLVIDDVKNYNFKVL